ncbi:MAG TPA: hypothetical protein VGG19_07845 [Tepidisphaeraceae bacterium]|jgi:hypothetical protein
MAIEQRFCTNHPQRAAIGVCVITKKAICGECSTRYNGVNYSIEGLQILRQREQAQSKSTNKWLIWAAVACLTPLMLFLMYLSYACEAGILAGWLHRDKL